MRWRVSLPRRRYCTTARQVRPTALPSTNEIVSICTSAAPYLSPLAIADNAFFRLPHVWWEILADTAPIGIKRVAALVFSWAESPHLGKDLLRPALEQTRGFATVSATTEPTNRKPFSSTGFSLAAPQMAPFSPSLLAGLSHAL